MSSWGKVLDALRGLRPRPRPTTPAATPVPRVATLAIWAKDMDTGQPVAGALVDCLSLDPPVDGTTNADGYFAMALEDRHEHVVEVHADGYPSVTKAFYLDGNTDVTMVLTRAPRPAAAVRPRVNVAAIRGAMWTAYLNLPHGPRPGQDTNILAMDFYEFYGPDDRQRMIDRTLALGYTHAVTGPLVDPDGYHGRYPTNTDTSQAKWDHYLDAMQEWQDAGIIPVHFMKPDGWTLPQLRDRMEHLYSQDRAKALLPILVPAGWEPTRYAWSSRTWGTFFDWAAQLNPAALIFGHTEADVDAMKGTDAVYNDEPETNDKAWQYLAPKLHGWLIQLGGFGMGAMLSPDEERVWEENLQAYFRDAVQRFHHGYAGWPTGSKWGAHIPLKLIYAEAGSYKFFWNGQVPEALVRRFGDLAMAAGADGYLDGGTVIVP